MHLTYGAIILIDQSQFILLFNLVQYEPATYGAYVYPLWADAVGWLVGLLPVIVIIAIGVVQVCKAPRELTLREKLRLLLRPTAEWGPSGRPCWTPVDLRAISSYSSATYTRVLINNASSMPPSIAGDNNSVLAVPNDVLQL